MSTPKSILVPKISKLLNFKNKDRTVWQFCAEKQVAFKVGKKKSQALFGFPHSSI